MEDMTYAGTADKYLDSRDLEEWLETYGDDDPDDVAIADEIIRLRDEGISDWQYGAQLIREDSFTEYAQQLAEDIGAVDPDASWPLSYIDWQAAADALKQDYAEIEYLGHTYLVRA